MQTRNWKTAVVELSMIALLALLPVRGSGQEPTSPESVSSAEVDTLLFYVEQLEHDLAISRSFYTAEVDSLQIELRIKGWEIEAWKEQRRRWYESPIIHFTLGVVVATVVMATSLSISF